MSTITAIYENGVFRPEVAPDLPNGSKVELKVVFPKLPRLVGTVAVEYLRRVTANFDPATDRPEVTSNNVDEVLYGKKGDSGDVR